LTELSSPPRARPGRASTLDDALRAAYLDVLTLRYRLLDLSTLTPDRLDEQLQVGLAQVFVPQHVRADPPPVELPRDLRRRLLEAKELDLAELPEELDRELLAKARAMHKATASRPVLDVVTEPTQRLTVVLGDPGAGKSSLLRYLALAMSGQPHGDEALKRLDGWLPVLVELRDYADPGWRTGRWANGTMLDYLDHLYTQQSCGLPREVLEGYLRGDGRAVVMFDGLDELFDAGTREETTRRIAGFAARYPRVRVVVTSRIIGYHRALLDGAGFTVHTLQDLDQKQIERFVRRWYTLAFHTSPAESAQRTERLLAAIERSVSVRDLAGNPLLLTILASIGRRRELPKERHRVYQHAVEVLTQHWDVNKAVQDTSVAMDYIDEEDKRELLRRIARRMQAGEGGIAGNRLAGTDLVAEFESYLRERYQKPPDQARIVAKKMLEQFRDRNFILSRFGPGLYGFVHRALLEYCCADDIVYRTNVVQETSTKDLVVAVFGGHALDPVWHEVLLLVAGKIHERFLAKIIDHLLDLVPTPLSGENEAESLTLISLGMRVLVEARRLPSLEAQGVRLLIAFAELLYSARQISLDRLGGALLRKPLELDSAFLAVKDCGSLFPGRQAYVDWLRSTNFAAPSFSFYAESLDARIVEIATSLFPGDPELRDHLMSRVERRDQGLRLEAMRWRDKKTGTWLKQRAGVDDSDVRLVAVVALAKGWPDQQTHVVLVQRLRIDNNPSVRRAAVQGLAAGWRDERTRAVLVERARIDASLVVRVAAVEAYAVGSLDEQTRGWLVQRAKAGKDLAVRLAAMQALVTGWADERSRTWLMERASIDKSANVRLLAVRALARGWRDEQTHAFLAERAEADRNQNVRKAARALAAEWPDEP
jgi:HEAT repeat protein/NACHT domain-containing protein